MISVLITGAAGFVGPYLGVALRDVVGRDVRIIPTAHRAIRHEYWGDVRALDLNDSDAVRSILDEYQPSHVINLAGIASPIAASERPGYSWRVHVDGTMALAEAILDLVPACVLIQVGSGLAYGVNMEAGRPVSEKIALAPIGAYAATKASADIATGALVRGGLRCIRARPFNHTGPGQSEAFVVPSFAARIARIEAGLIPPVLKVGNLQAERDFLDVRDIADAYARLVVRSDEIAPGSIFNIGAGTAWRISDILNSFLAKSRVPVSVTSTAERMRPDDISRIVCDAGLIRSITGWRPRREFVQTLDDVLGYWRARVVSDYPDSMGT